MLTYPPLFTMSAVPSVLQRAFRTEQHARQFMAGHIRFGLLQHYRQVEGWSGDKTEGRASALWNLNATNPELHNVNYSGTSLEPYYVLCASHPEVCGSHLTRFGSFVVRINSPLQLLKRISFAWNGDYRASSDPFITPVLYDKGELVEPPPYYVAPPCLVYAQKKVSYSEDREYRYVLQCKAEAKQKDAFLTLNVGAGTDICSLVVR
jgi:hypothetical protein